MQTAQPTHVDGTFELTFGSMFLLAAIIFYGVFRLGSLPSLMGSKVLPFMTIVVFLGGGSLVDVLVKRFKKWSSLPRKALLGVRKSDAFGELYHAAIWVGIPVLTLALMGVLFVNRSAFHRVSSDPKDMLLPIFWGLLFSLLWFLVGRKIGLNRFNLMSAVSLAIGAALFVNGADGTISMMILFAALGVALCISGGMTLVQFLRGVGKIDEA